MTQYLNLTHKQRTKPVYRIIKPARLFELFEKREGVLVHPSCWEDPYENFVLRSKVRGIDGGIRKFDFHKDIYGQCWTLNKASDAMWRIYSHDHRGIRIKTTVRKLLSSLYHGGAHQPDMFCVIGRVEYLTEKRLLEFANGIYHDGALSKDDLFGSLLVKRKAFKHENEVRLLYFDTEKNVGGKLFRYTVAPHELIEQIMIDPRISYREYQEMKSEIKERTGFSGDIRRSLLYRTPEEIILSDTRV